MDARPDAGWSWVIAFSCSYIHLALFGIFRSAGVIFVALLDTYDTTREEAAWPFSLCSAIFQLTAPISSVACRYFSVRQVCLVGSVVATIGITGCFFADNVLWIKIFYGIVHGLGFGLVAALIPVIVNQYFVRYRATGVGIAFSGGTVSTFIFPVAMEFLLHIYGLQGTFLILGGVVLNTLVASSLLRAPPWLKKEISTNEKYSVENADVAKVSAKNDSLGSNNNEKSTIFLERYAQLSHSQTNIPDQRYLDGKHPVNANDHLELVFQLNSKNCMESKQSPKKDQAPNSSPNCVTNYGENVKDEVMSLCDNTLPPNALNGDLLHNSKTEDEHINGGTLDQVAKYPGVELNKKCHMNDSSEQKSALLPFQKNADGSMLVSNRCIPIDPDCTGPEDPLLEKRENVVLKKSEHTAPPPKTSHWWLANPKYAFVGEMIEVLCHPMFHILTLSMCFFFLSVHTFFMVIVDFAKDKGIPESQAIYVLSVFSATDLLARVGLGWVTDRNYVKRKNMVMINLTIVGVLNHFYPFATTVVGLFTIAAIHGLAVGSTITLFFVLQAEYLGMKRLPLVIGMASFINGVTTFLRPGMTGLFRDEIGSYDWMFHFLGILMLVIATAWLFEPWLRKKSKNFEEADVMSSRLTDIRKSSC